MIISKEQFDYLPNKLLIFKEPGYEFLYTEPFEIFDVVWITDYELLEKSVINVDLNLLCISIVHEVFVIRISENLTPVIITSTMVDYVNDIVSYLDGFIIETEFYLYYLDYKSNRFCHLYIDSGDFRYSVGHNGDLLIDDRDNGIFTANFENEANCGSLDELFTEIPAVV